MSIPKKCKKRNRANSEKLDFTPLSPEDIASALQNIPPEAAYLRPIFEAARDHGLVIGRVAQGGRLPARPRQSKDRATLSIVTDDSYPAKGPKAFHKPSLKLLFEDAQSIFLMSGLAPVAYRIALCDALLFQHHVIIIETRPEQESKWLAYVKRLAPNTPLMIVSPNGARYLHQGGTA